SLFRCGIAPWSKGWVALRLKRVFSSENRVWARHASRRCSSQSVGNPAFVCVLKGSRHEKRKIRLGYGGCALLLLGALPVECRAQRIRRYRSCGEFAESGERFVAGRVAADSDGGAKILGR